MSRRSRLLSAAGLLAASVAATGEPLERYEFARTHMGVRFGIAVYSPARETAARAAAAAFARVAELDAILSDYDASSELLRLSANPAGQPVAVSESLFHVLEEAQRLAEETGGAFDITAGPLVRLWRQARRQGRLPDPARLEEALGRVGWRHLELDPGQRTVTLLKPGMRLDAGGIAKGYAADEARAILRAHGLPRALVAAAGDIAAGEPPPGEPGWRVALGGDPSAATILLANAAVSTSGDTEQFVEIGGVRYSHIVDPRTGLGLTNRLQVTVIAPRAIESDSLATAVCVLGRDRGLALLERLPGAAARLLDRSASPPTLEYSPRWPHQHQPSERRSPAATRCPIAPTGRMRTAGPARTG